MCKALMGIVMGGKYSLNGCVLFNGNPFLIHVLLVSQLGTICGPLVGGDGVSWIVWNQQSGVLTTVEGFYINLPLAAVVAMPIFFMRIPEQNVKKSSISVFRELYHHLDLLSFALLAPAIIQILLALQYGGNQFAWNSSQVIGLFCGGGATFIGYLIWDYHKADDGLLPFPIIKRRPVWASGVNHAFMMAAVFGSSYFLPIYFQAVKGLNAVMSGVYLLALILPNSCGYYWWTR